MISSVHRALFFAAVTLAAGNAACAAAALPAEQPAPPASAAHDVSLDEYRQHLTALKPLVEACAQARDTKKCDPVLVGSDDRVALGSTRRIVRYDWLRVLLLEARHTDNAQAQTNTAKKDAPSSTSALLDDAQDRLDDDLEQAGATATAASPHATERATMRQILAGKDFRGLNQVPPQNAFLEKINQWLNGFFAKAANLRPRSPWVGRVLVWGFVIAVCIALVWALLQLERRWRVRLVPDDREPASGAASARAWQLWLEDARRAAAAGQWREAVHFVYWAAISRLESRRLWPADRARTPREYLALLAAQDPRREGLAALTGSFERIWYGGRAAAEADYRSAEQQAVALIDGHTESGAR